MNIELEQKLIDEVKKDPSMLEKIQEQTEEICLAAVKQRGLAIQYVKDQTEAICLEAVNSDPNALQYIKDQTEEVCLQALKNDFRSVCYINITKRNVAYIVLKVSAQQNIKDKKILTKIIENFKEDREFIDFYTKHHLWKYVYFSKVKLNDELIQHSILL